MFQDKEQAPERGEKAEKIHRKTWRSCKALGRLCLSFSMLVMQRDHGQLRLPGRTKTTADGFDVLPVHRDRVTRGQGCEPSAAPPGSLYPQSKQCPPAPPQAGRTKVERSATNTEVPRPSGRSQSILRPGGTKLLASPCRKPAGQKPLLFLLA
ncbi:unnamed protein product [Amoebophrya sp. A120]|nr:unnamed protein product [Amoebophrya sp. A120]|eukprot:GSA120T00007814001.1